MLTTVIEVLCGKSDEMRESFHVIFIQSAACYCGCAYSYSACDERGLRIVRNGVFVHSDENVVKPVLEFLAGEGERMEVKQGKLVMGFRVEQIDSYRKANIARIAVALFGGTANSLLFKNVREKLSLCYYCSAAYDRISGMMMVDSGVEAPNAEKARDEVLHQLELLQQGQFTDQELEETKLYIRTALKATTDSLGAMDSWYLTQNLGQSQVSPDGEIALSEQVTREEIIEVANNIKLDTVYMLMPNEQEKEGE